MKKIIPLAILIISNVLALGCTTYAKVPELAEDYETWRNPRFQPDVPFATSNINKNRNDKTEKK